MGVEKSGPAGPLHQLAKAPTGLRGLDEITFGGLPKGRVTLLCGGPGSGKTLLGMEFLVRGTTQYGEPGVFVSFEENPEELLQNVASLGFDLHKLESRKQIRVEHIRIERQEVEAAGEFNLEGLFIRIGHAVEQTGARRVVLDTMEALFSTLRDTSILRAEIRRLFRFLKEKGLTAIVTAELAEGGRSTRYNLEEYVSDCVIFLDNRVEEQISTRRLRVLKYRGSLHGTNEYPFLIDADGFFVMPVSSLELKHQASLERISTGIPMLDTMLTGRGFYRASTILVLGASGTGKSIMASQFAEAACRRGERALFFSFEESPGQIIRNMRSVGIELEPWLKAGKLLFSATRPYYYGMEQHLVHTIKLVSRFKPEIVVVDPMTDLTSIGSPQEVRLMLARLIDFLKSSGITAFFTGLIGTPWGSPEYVPVSSLVDTWILLREIESNGERNRTLHVLKSRGMAHSNQVREMTVTDHGLELVDVYAGPDGVLTGSARAQQQERDRFEAASGRAEVERRRARFDWRRKALEAEEVDLRREVEEARKRLASRAQAAAVRSGTGEAQYDGIEQERKTEKERKKAG